MRKQFTEVLVIGGGATGLSAARDAVMRGFKTLLLEKGDLAHGTSGRYHGLLHSGGRYVVSDPHSARDCIAENRILRKIIPSAIENTDGWFVTTPEDDPAYADTFLAACKAQGVPAEELNVDVLLNKERLLNQRISRTIRVPDAACDSFDATHILAHDIKARGAKVLLRHEVIGLEIRRQKVCGVNVRNLLTDEEFLIETSMVLNCSGAWAGNIAAMAGGFLKVTPGKGTMIAMNTRLVNTVVNRCKLPHDGDILVPVGTVSVIGTTDIPVESPDQYPIEDWEVEFLLNEGEALIPGFKKFRALRAWAGVRPLYDPTAGGKTESRDLTRSHAVIDHQARDGVGGLLTMVGGKFTTMRLMAQDLVDEACKQLRTKRPCTTAETPAEAPGTKHYYLAQRLNRWEQSHAQHTALTDPIICECELVPESKVRAGIEASQSKILNDLRRDTRLGMGPCQGGFCAYRANGIACGMLAQTPEDAHTTLAQFLQERWKGQRNLLWDHNLRQLELDQNIYRNLLGLDHTVDTADIELYPTEKTA